MGFTGFSPVNLLLYQGQTTWSGLEQPEFTGVTPVPRSRPYETGQALCSW